MNPEPHAPVPKEPDASAPPAHDTPANEARSALEGALRAFEQGDYKATRELAERARESDDDAVRKDASQLLMQLTTPPLTKKMLALTFALLVAVTLFAYAR